MLQDHAILGSRWSFGVWRKDWSAGGQRISSHCTEQQSRALQARLSRGMRHDTLQSTNGQAISPPQSCAFPDPNAQVGRVERACFEQGVFTKRQHLRPSFSISLHLFHSYRIPHVACRIARSHNHKTLDLFLPALLDPTPTQWTLRTSLLSHLLPCLLI